MKFSVVVADDHDVIREGIKSVLSKDSDYGVIGEAADGDEVIDAVDKLKPDLLLLDITMPKRSGLDLIEQVNYISPKTKIIIVTMHRANIYIDTAMKLGVKGYLNKDNVVEDILPAVRRVSKGEVYVSARASEYLMEKASSKEEGRDDKGLELTNRERDILRLVVEGKTAKEIAEILFISPRTVENHKNALIKKLGLHKTSDLIKYALQHKIVEPEG